MPVSICKSLLASDSLSSCSPGKSTDCDDCMERSDADACGPADGNSYALAGDPEAAFTFYRHLTCLTCPSAPLGPPALAFKARNGAQATGDSGPQIFIADSGITATNGLPGLAECTLSVSALLPFSSRLNRWRDPELARCAATHHAKRSDSNRQKRIALTTSSTSL